MESSESSSRRSERKRKRKESYSPEGKKESCKKNKPDGQKSQSRSKLSVSRLYDVLPNGEPFSCHLCKSPYVVNPMSKGVKKLGRSRHTPLPKVRTDTNTGREMMLCNACVQIFDRPQRRAVKTATIPTEEEKKKYQQEVDNFIKTLKAQFEDPLVERLFCPLSQRKLCGCLLRYIESTGVSQVPAFISLMKEAIELRKEKSYPITDDSKKVKFIGLGNGHKKSKRYEEFVLTKRRILKEDMRLCERATQKILMYSNNFLHKRLKTENRPCRVERTRGKAVLGQLPEFQNMTDLHCCHDNCVMMVLTHKRLLQSWRDRAQQGQQEARRVMAEMLTPAGATHHNCYSFISMVTGCSQSTIASVYSQMVGTGGLRDPPEHGMKKVWQDHYKQSRTSEGTKEPSASVSSADSLSQEVTSPHRLANQNTVIDFETLSTVRQHKLAWIQDLAKTHIQQQQLALHLQDLMSAKQKLGQLDQYQGLAQCQPTQLQNKPSETHKNALVKSNGVPTENLQHFPLSTMMCLNSAVTANLGQLNVGQGHNNSNQSLMQQILLQPPPQYGVNQTSADRNWNQSQLFFPVTVNQPNYLVTGDQQVLPVLPILKHGSEQQLLHRDGPVTDIQNQNINQSRATQILPTHFENLQSSGQTMENQNNSIITSRVTSENSNDSNLAIVGQTISLSNHSQNQLLKQYHISGDQAFPVLHLQTAGIEHANGDQMIAMDQVVENSARYVPTSDNQNQNENINPNIYFQILPETSMKANTLLSEKGSNVSLAKESTVSAQSGNYDFIAQSLARNEQTGQISDSQQTISSQVQAKQVMSNGGKSSDILKDKPGNIHHKPSVQQISEKPPSHKHLVNENIVANSGTTENDSTMILSNVSNQADQAFQQVNQTQFIVPVSLFPPSHSNEASDVQIPSQIQISFQTCSAENNQPNVTQQILLPHGNVVTLPLMPVDTCKDAAAINSQFVGNNKESSAVPENSAVSNLSVESSATTGLSRENLQLHFLNQKDLTPDNASKPQKSAVKSRNSSGNSKKSRNSSGSSELSRKSVVQFSNTVRSESRQEHGHTNAGIEHLSESHFASKLNKGRHRQISGNSEHEDRSRKSSGNSLISETSSHTSGLTLSNLASPNIFHDKDKGIFFIQSIDGLEFNEIDSNHLVDFIRAVEADQTGTTEEQNTDQNQCENLVTGSEITLLNQSGILETESRKGQNGRTAKNSGDDTQTRHFVSLSQIDSSAGVSLKQLNTSSKREEAHIDSKLHEFSTEKSDKRTVEYTDIDGVHMHSQNTVKRPDKKSRNTNSSKKQFAKSNQSNINASTEKVSTTENQSAANVLKHTNSRLEGHVSAAAFVPIAPKGSQQLWNVGATVTHTNTSMTSHNTPVLSSLLSKKPVTWTKKLFTSSVT